MSEEVKRVLERMRGLSACREYCSYDIMLKLKRYEKLSNQDRDIILSSLQEDNFINNLRFASAYARDKASIDGWGEKKISYTLALKRISSSDISLALKEIDVKKADGRLEKLVLNKIRVLKNDPQLKIKLIKFLISRGYSYDKSKEITEKCISYEL